MCNIVKVFLITHVTLHSFLLPFSLFLFVFQLDFCLYFLQICFSRAMMQASNSCYYAYTLSKVNYGRTSSTRPDLMTNITFTMLILYFWHIFFLDKVFNNKFCAQRRSKYIYILFGNQLWKKNLDC